MLLHVDQIKFKSKPTGSEIGGIKHRLTRLDSIKDLTIKEISIALASGQTIQPGVTPFSDESRLMGRKGTVKEDFTEQTLFMVDIDNKRTDILPETPEHAAGILAMHNLRAAFMYPTFGSKQDSTRFRISLVCDTPVTDRGERDRIQAGLISIFPQADADCTNADRIFFGTDKGLISTDPDAVCSFADLFAVAAQEEPKSKYGRTIPEGQRHKTLLSFAVSILK